MPWTLTNHHSIVFENLRFQLLKTPFMSGRNAKTEKNTFVFKNIRIRVDRA
jgi:hypothetical protein